MTITRCDLVGRVTRYVYAPGNGTRYDVVITPIPVGIGLGTAPGSLLVALWPGTRASAAMLANSPPHWRYVAEKLRLVEQDAVHVAHVIRLALRDSTPFNSAKEKAK